jgi:hypothetical protein
VKQRKLARMLVWEKQVGSNAASTERVLAGDRESADTNSRV